MDSQPELRMYSELARWWPLFSPPSHYVEEAAELVPDLLAATHPKPETMLELGSGGGSLAYHLKRHFRMTLTDRSEEMLKVSRAVNPECEHICGDMRTLNLDRKFDVVFIHDAIMYMTDEASVRATIATAAGHCRTGGAVFLLPDHVKQEFEPSTDCGGEDGPDGRGFRYLEWSWDPNPDDDTFDVAYSFLMRENGRVSVAVEHNQMGLFPRERWLAWLTEAGFRPSSRIDPWDRDVMIGHDYQPRT
jgi:SAM-dependent methyltransferase